MSELFLKYRSKVIIFFSIVFISLALFNIYYVVEVNVTSNDECLWIQHRKKASDSTDVVPIIFSNVKVDGVAWVAGIRDGDQLLEINNQPFKTTFKAQRILNEFKFGEAAPYKVRKPNGEILDTKVYIKKLVQFGLLAVSLSALIWMLIGFIVLTARPNGLAQRLFYALGVLLVFVAMVSLMPLFGGFYLFYQDHPIIASLVGSLNIIGLSFLPYVLIAFVWTFPKPFNYMEKTWVKLVLIFIPLLTSMIGNVFAFFVFNQKVLHVNFFDSFMNVAYITVIASYIVALVSMIIQYRRLKTREEKKPILIILISMFFGVLVSIYTGNIAPAIADTIYNSPEYYAPIILLVLVPLGFAYSILKYQLLDVGEVIKNTILYGSATIAIAAGYFLVIYIVGQGLSQAIGTENQGVIAGIFFIVFALVFQSTKDRFQEFITKRFYPEQFAYQRVLIKFNNDVSTAVGLENIIELTENTFVEALQIKKFGILIRDNTNGSLRLARSYGIKNTDCTIKNSNIGHYLGEKIKIDAVPVVQQSEFEKVFPENYLEMIEEGFFTAVPMTIKSKVVGLMLFGLKHSGSQFVGKDLELLNAAANQTAVSIENARLYESENEKIKIERDLDLARKIQQSLLPQKIPSIKGLDICGEMIPAMQVGGDYFDFISVSESKLFIAVGDVSGKGLSSSLYMTKLQTMIQLACSKNNSPREILADVNKRLYESMERSWFVTMTLALFDMDRKTIRYCRAGHLPLLKANNGEVESLKSRGIGLGLEKGIIFEQTLKEEEMKLTSGETYAFFSDGVTEAMDEHNQLFSEERLKELLAEKSQQSSSSIMNSVWSELNKFRGKIEPNDDMTMVIVKVG